MKLTIVYIFLFASITTFGQELDSINSVRAKHNLPPLKHSPKLQISAKTWLIRSDGQVKHDFSTKYGEIITNSDDPVSAWMNSKPHRNALLSRRYTKIGISRRNGVTCARLD